MNVKSLIRNPAAIHNSLVETPDGRLLTKTGCKIHIPARYAERGLADVGVENFILGLYAMIVDDTYYAVSTVCAFIKVDPTSVTRIKVNSDDYYELYFEAGSTVFPSLDLVKRDTLVYNIYDELFSKGYIPWYFGYNDLGRVFDTAKKHAGTNIGSNKEVTELIVSLVSRDAKDKTKYYRTAVNTLADLEKNLPEFIALRDVTYAATNTTNRLGGSYAAVGIVASLNNPSDRTERIESLLRA